MKIKYIVNVRLPTPRAQGYAIMKMCSEFAKVGAEVELVVPARKNEDKDPFLFYGIEKNFKISKVFSPDLLGRTYFLGRLFYWIDIFSFLLVSRFAVKVGQRDALYTRDFLTLLFFPKNKFICLEIHDMPKNKFILKMVLPKPKLFFVINNNLKEELIKLGVDQSKIFIARSGVDVEKFDIKISQEEARQKLGMPLREKIVMYSGQFYSWKGAETLAEAARILSEPLFVFIGGIEPELSKFIEKYGGLKNIHILPFQERSIIPIYLKAADILVLPNSAREEISVRFTSPLKLFEYMAAGKPIVASNLPSIKEVVSQEECVFAEPDDPKSLADSIEKLISNEKLSQKIALNAHNKAGQFSWNKRAGGILNTIIKCFI